MTTLLTITAVFLIVSICADRCASKLAGKWCLARFERERMELWRAVSFCSMILASIAFCGFVARVIGGLYANF